MLLLIQSKLNQLKNKAMKLSKAEKVAIAQEQQYIKKVRTVFDSLKYLGSGGATMKQINDDFDRLNLARTGLVFAALLTEAIDNGFEIREGDAKDQAPISPLFDIQINTAA